MHEVVENILPCPFKNLFSTVCKKGNKMITQEMVKSRYIYNPDTGKFTSRRTNKVLAGAKHSRGYLQMMINRKLFYMHRIAWLYVYGEFPTYQIDHKNRIRDDNRWCNLLGGTKTNNQRNRSIASNNTSGVIGVRYRTTNDKWQATINTNGKRISLGHFKHKEEAIVARRAAEQKHGYKNQ